MTGPRLRVLAAGFAGIGSQDHQSAMYLPAFARHDAFELVGVVGVDGDHAVARAAGERYGVRMHEDLDGALDDPTVDVVSVAAPIGARAQTVAAALKAGKHVLADKPLASTVAETVELADLAAAQNVALVPAHHQRLHGVLRAARGALRAGRVGLPWNVQADFLVAGGDPVPGGELHNLGLYPIDVVHALLGLGVRRVHACGGQARPDGSADPTTVLLDHEHDVTSTITCGRIGALRDVPPAALAVHRYRVSGSHGVLLADALKPAAVVHTGAARDRRWHGQDTVHALLDVLHTAVTTGHAELGAADAVYTQQVVDAARRSLETGAPIDITDPRRQHP